MPKHRRVVAVDRTRATIRGEGIDHLCADSFELNDERRIVEGWICHVDVFR